MFALFGLMAAPFVSHTVDDAYITFRYSRQWGLGHGPYLNPGEHVEGYSNFLLMLLMTPVIRSAGPGAAVPFSKALGCVAGAAALLGSFLIGRSLARASKIGESPATLAGLVAAGCVACAPGFDVNAVSGLETALYSACVTLGALGLASRSVRGLRLGAVALAAAALTRPEGPLIFALGWTLAALDSATSRSVQPQDAAAGRRRTRRDFIVAGLIGAAAVGAHLVFRRICYDGEWVPNTFFAKVAGTGDRLEYVWRGASHPFLGPAGLLAALAGWLIEPRTLRVARVAGGIGLAGVALPLVTGADWMLGWRLIAPFLPVFGAVVVVGWLRLALRIFRGRPGLAAMALAATLPGAFLLQDSERRFIEHASSVEATGARTGHAALAAWLRRDARPGDAVALMDIGQIGFECIEQRMIDVIGLTDRFIAKSPGPFMDRRFDPAYVFDQQPRYVVLALTAPGGPYDPLPAGARLAHFSKIEARLAGYPEFSRHYVNVRAPSAGAPTPFERLAAAQGAEAIFPYAVPERHYLLAVFRRHA